MEETIRFQLNGKKTELKTDPNQTLLWVLRNQLGLTGTKYGCGTGFCGACTVIIDNEAVKTIQGMPRWKPAMRHGKPVNFRYLIRVNFMPIS